MLRKLTRVNHDNVVLVLAVQLTDKTTDLSEREFLSQGEHLVFIHVIDVYIGQKTLVLLTSCVNTCPYGLQRNTGCAVVGNNRCDLANTFVAESALVETEAPISGDVVSASIYLVMLRRIYGIMAAFLVISLYSRATSNGNGPAMK